MRQAGNEKIMIACKQVKKQIDEADQPDRLSFEAASHAASCADCQSFADERTSLRQLLGTAARVTAPQNFDAQLRAQLHERMARKTRSWLSPAFYMQFGAAAAVLVMAVFVAQYAGLLSTTGGSQISPTGDKTATVPGNSSTTQERATNTTQPVVSETALEATAPISSVSQVAPSAPPRRWKDSSRDIEQPQQPDMTAADIPVVIVMGRNGEMEVPMPTVSVGAQPLLYSNAGQPLVRNVRTSF